MRLLGFVLAAAMVVVLAGCGKSDEKSIKIQTPDNKEIKVQVK